LNNKEAMLRYMEATHSGVRGLVVDQNGQPVAGARVSRPPHISFLANAIIDVFFCLSQVLVEGIRKPVRTTVSGEYWRLLTPGKTYSVYATAKGYGESERHSVRVKDVWDGIHQFLA
jgi:hypothetical protein